MCENESMVVVGKHLTFLLPVVQWEIPAERQPRKAPFKKKRPPPPPPPPVPPRPPPTASHPRPSRTAPWPGRWPRSSRGPRRPGGRCRRRGGAGLKKLVLKGVAFFFFGGGSLTFILLGGFARFIFIFYFFCWGGGEGLQGITPPVQTWNSRKRGMPPKGDSSIWLVREAGNEKRNDPEKPIPPQFGFLLRETRRRVRTEP